MDDKVAVVLRESKQNLTLFKNLFLENATIISCLSEESKAYASTLKLNIESLLSKIEAIFPIQGTLNGKIATIYDVIYCVCQYYKVSEELIKSKSRKRESVLPRQMTMYICCKLIEPRYSVKFVGKTLGGFKHPTVSHSCKSIKNELQTDAKIKNDINKILSLIIDLHKNSDGKTA